MSLIMGDHGDESSNKEESVDVTLLQESASGKCFHFYVYQLKK